MISAFKEMVYKNQIASFEYFWSDKEKNFHHSCFRELAEREINNIWHSQKLEPKLRMRNIEIESVNLSPEGMVNFNIVLPGEQWKENPEKELKFSVPPVTKKGTFLLENNGKIIEKAFILNLIPSPGLSFTVYGACLRPYRYGYWIKFFTEITDDIKRKLPEDEELIDLIVKFGCVELKRKKYLLTPLFLHLLGISDKDITGIYKESLTEELLTKIKDFYYKGTCRDDISYLIDPGKKKNLTDDNEILTAFKREILEKFTLDKTGRWQIKRRFARYNIGTEEKEELTLNDIKGIAEILRSKPYEPDDVYSLSDNIVLQVGDYLEETLLKVFKSTGKSLKAFIKDKTLSFEDFINFLQIRFIPFLERSIKNLFTLSPLSQVLPGTNILNDVNYQKRITRCGPGGISKDRAEDFRIRDIHPSYYGRICPLDTPQSEKIGLVLSLTEYAGINRFGILQTPYLRVTPDGEVTDEIIWLTPDEETDKYIAFGDQRNNLKDKEVWARKGKEELVKKQLKDICYIDYSTVQPFSIIPQLIPFLFCNDPARMVVAVSLFKQSIPLKNRELPLIYTGMEEKVAEASGQLLFDDGKVNHISDLHTSILGILKGREAVDPVEINGKKLVAEPPSSKEGSFAPGVNLLCAYVPWKGYNFEDAIVISESASKKLTSRHFDGEIEFQVSKEIIFKKDNPFYSEDELAFINDDGFIKTGTSIRPGDLLISAVKKDETFKEWMRDFTMSIFGSKAEGYKDMSLKVPEGVSGIVTAIEQSTNLITIKIFDERPVCIGDKISNRYGGKGVISLILPDKDMPYIKDGNEIKPVEILLNPLGVTSRMNLGQIMETHLGLCAKKTGGRFKVNASGEMTFYSDSPYEKDINNILNTAGDISVKIKAIFDLLSLKDKAELRDPLNNDRSLDNPVVAGYQYFMKLIHQAREKFYFRTEGDYSLITAQPLKGKKLGGGQKVGEMEGWAYQSHRAFNLLEEMFTVRSDDLTARESRIFLDKGTPESVKAFIYYMRGLCVDMILSDGEHDITEKILSDEYGTSEIKHISIKVAEDGKIKRWASGARGEVKSCESVFTDDMAEEHEGLYSSHIFGEWRKGKVSNIKDIRTKMGYIKLPCPVENPLCKGKKINFLPVIPFSYRPVIEMNGEIIKHDLNRYYEEILHLKYRIEHYDSLCKKNKKTKEELEDKLSYTVWNLFNNGKKAHPVVDSKGIALKSLITLLDKKEGHFRKNMLGKRVDYSGRGVIVVDPELAIDEVYIPCDETAEKTVVLNRQPTLHRMSVMAFHNMYKPSDNDYRSKSRVIFLNPLVTGGFGADFDGDTMAFYLPSGEKALKDTEKMFSSHNFLSPANGELHFNLGQDIKLGITYANTKKELKRELLEMIGLDGNREEVTTEDFKTFIIKLLSDSKDIKCLKDVLTRIFYYGTLSGTTFSLFDLPYLSKGFTLKDLPKNNTLFMVYPAKARGNEQQIGQICYRKGEVARISDTDFKGVDIDSFYLKGLNTGEYFYSCYGSIKTHVDKKLSTGHAGELARHLIEAVYDYRITEYDCKTEDGIDFIPGVYNKSVTGRFMPGKSTPVTDDDLINAVKLRSPVTCKAQHGICQMCYGLDLSKGTLPDIGTPVGIIAAQSTGEKGTQFQMKTVHSGGARTAKQEQDIDKAGDLFYASKKDNAVTSLLSVARNIYPKDSINDIHFEVIFKSMLSKETEITGLKTMVKSEGFLKSLSFGSPFLIMTKYLKKGVTDSLDGLKKNLLFMINPEEKGDDSNGKDS